MLLTIVSKELRALLLSPKFAATFGVCSLLILLSVFVGIQEYRTATRQYEAAMRLTDQNLRTQSNWMGLSTLSYRKPDPIQIVVTGVNNDIGRLSAIQQYTGVKLTNSVYSDDPIFAVFRSIDLMFVVAVVLSLFAILFTYDSVNGEREGGTLQLTFANPVPRRTFIFAKLIGAWCGLVVPLCVPILLGILMLLLAGVPMEAEQWSRLFFFLGVSLLYFTFAIALGVCLSALTQRSAVSFLVGLVVWVTMVVLVPRLGVMAAGQLRPVPTVAEVEGERDAFGKDRWEGHMRGLQVKWESRERAMQGMSKAERERYRDAQLGEWMAEDDAERKGVQKAIDEYSTRLNEDQRNRKADQERLAFLFSRISPASSYQLAAMQLAGTDIGIKERTEDAMREYRSRFLEHTERKQKESGSTGGFRIEVNSERGVTFSAPRESGALDLSDLPTYMPPRAPLSRALEAILPDVTFLGVCALLAFAGAVAAFLRTDIR